MIVASAISMRTYYNQQFKPKFHDEASPRTIAEYSSSLVLWELLTDDVPLQKIDNDLHQIIG